MSGPLPAWPWQRRENSAASIYGLIVDEDFAGKAACVQVAEK